ncbi:MAG: tyrosine-type recombinase/integrase [Solirubrobacteraceae bacterium]
MSALAPTLQAFFTDYLLRQRQASPHTIIAYRDAIRLLLQFTAERTGKQPHQLDIADLDAPLMVAFLAHLEHERHNTVRTRNARLAAIHSLYHYAGLRHPEHAALIARVLAIPPKRAETPIVTFLTEEELDALLAAPDRSTWTGRRDHALILLAAQTGLRAAELIGLDCSDIHLGASAHVNCLGKGRKHRVTPLIPITVATLKVWVAERAGSPSDPLFPTRQGRRLSHDALEHRLAKHASTARRVCPSLAGKKITPHILRHTAAVRLLHAPVDTATIALWLGHESDQTTQIYLHADLKLKQRAIDRTTPPGTKPGRYQPPDALLAFLEAL